MAVKRTKLGIGVLAWGAAALITWQTSWSGDQLAHPKYGLGQALKENQIRAWDIDIASDGTGLPAGSGTVQQGQQIFEAKCASCHGVNGQNGVAEQLVGGGNLNTKAPVKTIGSYWPYATTLFDYIRRAMPYGAPQSLSNDEVYSLSAYLLNTNKIIDADAVMTAQSLPKVRMPNRDGFIVDSVKF